jgi:YbbR domain-containing protein
MVILRWLGKHVSTLILAFALSLVVWVSAETARDPNQEQLFPRPVNIEIVGQDPALLIEGNIPTQARVNLNAPRSVWTDLITTDQPPIRAWIDMTGLGAGEHTVPVQVEVNRRAVRIMQITPPEIHITLEPEVRRIYQVNIVVEGEPAIGYQAGDLDYTPKEIVVIGAESIVNQVAEVRAQIDINGAVQTVETTLSLEPLNNAGEVVEEVFIQPSTVDVYQPVTLLGGYRNVIVKPVYSGQLEEGYKLTNITVTPPAVVVFSSNLQLLTDLPGFIETEPLDLTGAQEDVEAFLALNIPEGIEVPNEQRVLVQISISAIESNLAVPLTVEVVGLGRNLAAQVAPTTVDVIFSGPLPVLNAITPSDIRVMVDVAGRDVGVYQMFPTVTFLPERVRTESILPSTVEVTLFTAPTPTPVPVTDQDDLSGASP